MVDQGAVELESPQEFACRLGLKFKESCLLIRALTHRSYLNEHPEAIEDNERLEFLGDAVLDFLVGAWLYNRFPEKREGELTRLRSALVRTEQLAEFAALLDFGSALRLGKGESLAGGRQRSALLCAAFESVIGAIYLESGFESVQEFIGPLLDTAVDQILITNRDQDPKSRLQELVQAHGFGTPHYRTLSTSGPEHLKSFEVAVVVNEKELGRGMGPSKHAAAKVAARSALEKHEIELNNGLSN